MARLNNRVGRKHDRLRKEIAMRRAIGIAAVVVVVTLALTGFASAAQTAPSGKKDAGARIEKAKNRIEKMISRAEQMKKKAINRTRKARDKLNKVAGELKAQGKDISKLLADLDVLESKLKTAGQDADALINKLKEARGLASQATVEQLKAALKSAGEIRGRVRADIKEIRQYVRTVIRPEIRSLRGNSGNSGGMNK